MVGAIALVLWHAPHTRSRGSTAQQRGPPGQVTDTAPSCISQTCRFNHRTVSKVGVGAGTCLRGGRPSGQACHGRSRSRGGRTHAAAARQSRPSQQPHARAHELGVRLRGPASQPQVSAGKPDFLSWTLRPARLPHQRIGPDMSIKHVLGVMQIYDTSALCMITR